MNPVSGDREHYTAINYGPGWNDDYMWIEYTGIVERTIDPTVPTVSTWGLIVLMLLVGYGWYDDD